MKKCHNNRGAIPRKVADFQPQSGSSEKGKSAGDDLFEELMKASPSLASTLKANSARDELTGKEVLLDIEGNREGRPGKARTYQNTNGQTKIELINGNILKCRKTLGSDGMYFLEYFDYQGVLSRKIDFFCCGRVSETRYDSNGRAILTIQSPSLEKWKATTVKGILTVLKDKLSA